MSMICNKRQLSDILGVSEVSLTKWQRDGLPMEVDAGRGGSNQYDTARVIEWMIQRALAGAERETARERRDRLEGDMLELKLAKEAGALVAVAEVEPVWSAAILAARAELRSWGERLRAEIESRHQVEIDPALFAGAVDSILRRLAESPPDLEDEPTLEAADEPNDAAEEDEG
jgi:phage terminase Nu1 subunit (DNA packaging protein)